MPFSRDLREVAAGEQRGAQGRDVAPEGGERRVGTATGDRRGAARDPEGEGLAVDLEAVDDIRCPRRQQHPQAAQERHGTHRPAGDLRTPGSPPPERLQHRVERVPLLGEFVDGGARGRVEFVAVHDADVLEFAQALGEHVRAHVRQAAAQRSEAQRPEAEFAYSRSHASVRWGPTATTTRGGPHDDVRPRPRSRRGRRGLLARGGRRTRPAGPHRHPGRDPGRRPRARPAGVRRPRRRRDRRPPGRRARRAVDGRVHRADDRQARPGDPDRAAQRDDPGPGRDAGPVGRRRRAAGGVRGGRRRGRASGRVRPRRRCSCTTSRPR